MCKQDKKDKITASLKQASTKSTKAALLILLVVTLFPRASAILISATLLTVMSSITRFLKTILSAFIAAMAENARGLWQGWLWTEASFAHYLAREFGFEWLMPSQPTTTTWKEDPPPAPANPPVTNDGLGVTGSMLLCCLLKPLWTAIGGLVGQAHAQQ